MNKEFVKIRKILKANNLEPTRTLDIVLATECALAKSCTTVEDDEFGLICEYVDEVYEMADSYDVQLMADIVVDCIWHKIEYYQCDDIDLTSKEIANKERIDEVVEAYSDRYHEENHDPNFEE